MNKIKLKIDGMSCGHCVNAVKNAILTVPGVTGASVDLASASAQYQGELTTINDVKSAIEEEGYAATQIE